MAEAVKAAAARQLPAFKLGKKQVFLYVPNKPPPLPLSFN